LAKRNQQRVERRLVVEYVEQNYPDRLSVYYNLRVGKPPEAMQRAFPGVPASHFKVWQGFVDALVVLAEEFILIEAKVYHPENGVGQLDRYAEDLYDTEELKIWGPRPIRKLLVTARAPPQLIEFAGKRGVDIAVYRPDWIQPILRARGLM